MKALEVGCARVSGAPNESAKYAAVYGLCAEEDIVAANEGLVVKSGLAMTIPDGYHGRIAPMLTLAAGKHIKIGAEVIDKDCRDEIGVAVFNHYS